MVSRTLVGAVAIGMFSSVVATEARVTRIEIVKVESSQPGYETLSGRAYGELDPNDPKNALITDIQSAPRNARGMVEYVATFSLMKPIDMSQSSGVLIYSVVNRGGGAATASAEGHVSLVSGWQADVVPTGEQVLGVPPGLAMTEEHQLGHGIERIPTTPCFASQRIKRKPDT